MGRVKEFFTRYGYYPPLEKYVCSNCIDDYAIKKFILENAKSNKCSYCGKQNKHSKIAADINDVIIFILEGIETEWGDPSDEGVGWDSGEGGWVGAPVIDTYDLLLEEVEIGFNNDELFNDLLGVLCDRQWCQIDPYGLLPQDELITTWEGFSYKVKHKARYVFFRADEGEAIIGSQFKFKHDHEILDYIGKIVYEFNLVKKNQKGTIFYRGRASSSMKKFNTVEDLSPPPFDKAIYSNRMSCAGIPLFYGALDRDTAIAEIYDSSKKRVLISTAKFETLREFYILDLTELPSIPSLFEEQKRHYRAPLIFLHLFLDDLSKPISKDGYEHIEYVPTQIMTEYFKQIFKFDNGKALDGIYYPSARFDGGVSCVLFFNSDNCIVDKIDKTGIYEKTLSMISTSVKYKKMEER